jgi:hypothetical protein
MARCGRGAGFDKRESARHAAQTELAAALNY